jgi:hypothetical protein
LGRAEQTFALMASHRGMLIIINCPRDYLTELHDESGPQYKYRAFSLGAGGGAPGMSQLASPSQLGEAFRSLTLA